MKTIFMNVYVVTKGEKYENGIVESIFHKYEDASKFTDSFKAHFNGGWEKDKDTGMYWTNGCDFVSIDEYEVK